MRLTPPILLASLALNLLAAIPTTAQTTDRTTTRPVADQFIADRIGEAENIPPEEWRAMATGRTLTYKINGAFWALEHYYPGTNRVTLQISDGSCLQGTWDYTAPLYCFHWEGQGTACFRHARLDDEILIIETQDGQDTPMLQTMTDVTDVPLTCGPAVIS